MSINLSKLSWPYEVCVCKTVSDMEIGRFVNILEYLREDFVVNNKNRIMKDDEKGSIIFYFHILY